MVTRFILSLFCCWSLSAATYYVSTKGNDITGSGSKSNPWRTIRFGMDAMARGDTLYLRGGTYIEPGIDNAQVKNGISNTKRTVIASYPGERAIFKSNEKLNDAIRTSGQRSVDFVTFDGFTIDGSLRGTHGGKLMKMYTLRHVTLTNMHFLNNTNGSMLQFYSEPSNVNWPGTNIHVVNCLFSNVCNKTKSDGTKPAASHHIYWNAHPGSIIEGNTFANSFSTDSSYGNTAITDKSSGRNWVIRNNYFTNCHYGVHFSGSGSRTYNNLIVNSRRSGIRVRGGQHLIAHNTVWAAIGVGADYGIENHDSAKAGNKFVNNIAWGKYDIRALMSRLPDNPPRASYWTNNIGISATFDTYAVRRGNRIGSEFNPLFRSPPTVFTWPAHSPAHNSGVNLSAIVTHDKYGTTRPQGSAVDLGMFELSQFMIVHLTKP